MTVTVATNALMSPIEAVPSHVASSDSSFSGETSDSSLSGCETSNADPVITIQPIVTICKSSGNKRPQMKYDPEVPLSKEETSAWRREQRRKRNRESAAACRKRQRDRISELEGEVSDWKAKFEEAVKKLREIDGPEMTQIQVNAIELKFPERCGTPTLSCTASNERLVSPCVSTNMQNFNMVSPVDSSSKFVPHIPTSVGSLDFPALQDTVKTFSTFSKADSINLRVEKGQHLSEMITRPAVKITGAVPTPLSLIESACDELLELVPDSILSSTEMSSIPFPRTCPSLVQNAGNNETVGEGDAHELDEFLLDAVQWL
jgi:hypothetical protein